MQTREQVVAALQAHEAELRAAGVRALALFGSVARGGDRPESDVDLAVQLDPQAHLGLRFFGLEQRVGTGLSRSRFSCSPSRSLTRGCEPTSSATANVSFDRRAALLTDILENIARTQAYVQGLDRAAFECDDRTHDAVERCLERICEAAARLGERAATLMPQQSWAEIRGMGNRLRHGHDQLSLDIAWNIIQHDLPALAADARAARDRLGQ